MKVSYIIHNKPKAYQLIQASSESSLSRIVDMLSEKRVGTIVIVDEGKLSGIISERDIVRILAANAPDVLEQAVGNYMTKEVECCHPEDLVSEVLERMSEGRFRHMPAMEKGQIVGLVSIGDVTKIQVEMAQAEADQMRQYIAAG